MLELTLLRRHKHLSLRMRLLKLNADEGEAADERRCCCCFVRLLPRPEALVLHADGQYCNAGVDAES